MVYRALDTKLKRDVAIKVLHPHLARQKEAVERFQREAVTVAKLQHPNIIDIYDYSGEDSVDRYIITELIDGDTLAQFVEQYEALPSEMVACIGREICLALKHAHGQGVIHRDLKPENVMIRKDGKIKLMDFGIARVMEGANLTITGSILGSPAFMSPEQITGQKIDFSSDLFSVGSILYLMATGMMPFKGQNPHEIFKKVLDGDYIPAQHVAPEISDDFSVIIDRLLCVKREMRYVSADELLNDLDGIIKEAQIDRPSKEVSLLFADPEAYVVKFNIKLCELLERKALDMRNKIPALAMQYYNRLLAIDPENIEANRQLERILYRKNLGSRIKKISLVGLALFSVSLFIWLVITFWQPSIYVEEPKQEQADRVIASFPDDEKIEVKDKKVPDKKSVVIAKKKPGTKKQLAKPTVKTVKGSNGAVKKEVKDSSLITGSLGVSSVPWSDIYINGKKVGNYPIDANKNFNLKEGDNLIRLVNPSCESYQKTIKVTKAGQVERIKQRLKMLPAYLDLDNSQGAMLFIDGKFRGRTPVKDNLDVRWDKHVSQKDILVSLTKEGYKPYNGKVRFAAGKTITLKVSLKKK